MTDKSQNAKDIVPRLINTVIALAIACLVLVISLGGTIYLLSKKKIQGYAATDTGRVIPLVGLDKPYVTDSRVSGFVDECLRKSLSHDFENFRMTMAAAKDCYTPTGAEAFEIAMSPLLHDIRDRSLVMAVSMEPSVVVQVFVNGGVVYWKTQTVAVLSRRGGRDTLNPLRFRIECITQRIPLDHHVRGIALRSINMSPI